ncbi:preprotein translocase, SecE subunit domain protein [Lacticaseibacillus paracasei]|nr:preprotein translocase, SecE subunit domain protein [Lacticaseibacillus paracasei]
MAGGHWEPGKTFQEVHWVEDSHGGCGCIGWIVLIAIIFGVLAFVVQYLWLILIIAILGFLIWLFFK